MTRRFARLTRGLKRALSFAALAYPGVLVLIVLLLRFVGEKYWVTAVGLYLPRIGFALPLPFCVLWLALAGPRKWLYSQAIAVLVLLFPLLGFTVPIGASRQAGLPTLRILSYNTNGPYSGYEKVAESIYALSPDVVLAQELNFGPEGLAKVLKARYPFSHAAAGEFLVASKFPILQTQEFPWVPGKDREHSPRFVRQVLDTPLGKIAFYNVHPRSPRWVFQNMRGQGLRREILSGRIFSGASASGLVDNSDLREDQVRAIASHTRSETLPRVIAGDTNLPNLSPILTRHLSGFQDGFAAAGFGFGYTFPTRLPWMRIDRIMADDRLRFVGFEVGCHGTSDHLCVVADLQRR